MFYSNFTLTPIVFMYVKIKIITKRLACLYPTEEW